jgi:acyl carrier protein
MSSTDSIVRNILQKTLSVDLPADDANVNSQNIAKWDSLKHIQIILALEDAFRVEIDEEDMLSLDSLASIRAYIEKHKH